MSLPGLDWRRRIRRVARLWKHRGFAARRTVAGIKQVLRSWKSPRAIAYLVAIGIGFLALSFLIEGRHKPDHWTADWNIAFAHWLLSDPNNPHQKIVLIYVTNRSLDPFPYTSPVNRKLLAGLVQVADAAEAKAIGLDFVFDRETEPANDSDLIKAVKGARTRVVMGTLDSRTRQTPAERQFQFNYLLAAQRQIGHLYFDDQRAPHVIRDEVVRLVAERSSDLPSGQSFAEVLAEKEADFRRPNSRYIGWGSTFRAFNAEEVLSSEPDLQVLTALKNKYVLIGGNFPDRDQHLTSLSVWTKQRSPGVEIHAQILAQLLDNDPVRVLPLWIEIVVLLVLAVGGVLMGRWDRSGHLRIWVELSSVAAIILVSVVVFVALRINMPLMHMLVVWLTSLTVGHFSRHAFEKWPSRPAGRH